MQEQKRPHLPIGYWLKKADEVLTSRINEAQEANGLHCTEWQVLNFLRESSSTTRAQITEILSPFADASSLASTMASLVNRGLIEEDRTETGKLRLTDHGQKVHATALDTQKKVRQQAIQGINEADYVTTIRVLQQLVTNLTDEES